MTRLLRRTSFTTRLLGLVVVVMGVLVLIDYVALLQLPSRVARDTVEIALRENVASLNIAFREDRTELREAASEFVDRPGVGRAILEQDEATMQALLDRSESMPDDVRYAFGRIDDLPGVGVITAPFTIQSASGAARRRQAVVFYRPLTDKILEEAASIAGSEVDFALETQDRFVATSESFPDDLLARDLATSLEPDVATLEQVEVDGERLHLYSRTLSNASDFTLHALSSEGIEAVALREVRADVRAAIAGMTIATIAAFLFLVYFTGRIIRSVADRVRTLADGDYGTRMPVHGQDAFAELAESVNRLSVQLADQVGQLEQTAGAFRRTLETLEEGICVWDDEGQITYWNRGAEQLTGLARERARLDDPVIAFLHAERAPGTRRVTLPVRRSGAGLVVDLVVTAMPDGGILQTFRDTTMVEMLQQTQRNFMATAAHELRTPITTILGFADTLTNEELQLTDRQKEEFLTIIRDQSYQLQELTEAFFTNHQLANERVEVSITATTLASVIEDAAERVATGMPDRVAELRDVQVTVQPNCAALADRRALVGVVTVLLENAIKYGRPPVKVTVERSGGTVALLVRDEGPGIDLYHQAHVFDPFFRVDVDMRSGVGGAGLGLFTARKLVEAMHGVIRVRSTPGSGTTFIVELPAAPVETDEGEGDGGGGGRSLRLVG